MPDTCRDLWFAPVKIKALDDFKYKHLFFIESFARNYIVMTC